MDTSHSSRAVRTVCWAGAVWAVPTIVSMVLVDVTGVPLVSLPVFLSVLSVVLVTVTFFAYRTLEHKRLLSLETAHSFLAISAALDALLLINFAGMSVTEWATIVLPLYLGTFYGLYVLSVVRE